MSKKKDKKSKKADKPKRVELDYGDLEHITRATVQSLIDRGELAEDEDTHEIDLPEEIEAKRKKRKKDKQD